MNNRQLFRPDRSEIEQRIQAAKRQAEERAAAERDRLEAEGEAARAAEAGADTVILERDSSEERPAFAPRRRPVPPDATSAEAFYYLKQMNTKTPMVVLLDNGEELRGIIEWYDRSCIKLHRQGAPNLLLMKHAIRYMFKADE